MAITITFGIQKGGCGKSTTTGILSFLLSRHGYRTLVIDMDSQGNTTELLSQRVSNEFEEKSVLEAIQQNNLKKYIYPISENLDLLPANNFLATFPRWIYTHKTYLGEHMPFKGSPSLILDKSLDAVRSEYDFILIDTPPSLCEQTTNALCASDYVIILFENSKWCYSAIGNFVDVIDEAKKIGDHDTKILGILRTLSDSRRIDGKAFSELVVEDYPELVFNTVISRKAPIGRISLYGFEENPELNQALKQYEEFYKEMMERVQSK